MTKSRRTSRRSRSNQNRRRPVAPSVPQNLDQATAQAADQALGGEQFTDAGTRRLMEAINETPMPVMATAVSAAKVDVVDYKNTTVIYVNGERAMSFTSHESYPAVMALRVIARTGCVTLKINDLLHLQGE